MSASATAFRIMSLLGAVLLPLGLVSTASAAPQSRSGASANVSSLPVVTPTPQDMHRIGQDVPVPERARVLLGGGVDQPTVDVIRSALTEAGATEIDVGPLAAAEQAPAALTVLVGSVEQPAVADFLDQAGAAPADPLPAEGYALAAARNTVALGGADVDGTYYAAQTFRQLTGDGRVAGAGVVDSPSMPLRGSIEGFYGSPWTHAERMDQLAFYGETKMNTYIYTPKDDPYLRERWREPYPDEQVPPLHELIDQARSHHVDFTYAVSPGLSICYSDPADMRALQDKLDFAYQLGVREFSIPLDDIEYGEWNCDRDRDTYGEPSERAAGQAQADLLNTVQREFIASHPGAKPLQSVPTEYSDVDDSPYKTAVRESLDLAVQLMWTGVGVIPNGISKDEAAEAQRVWGRKVLVWDNYPVNDWSETTGRLLLSPYDQREAGLHEQVSGVALNPMNQAAASKVALFGGADFSWNDTDYDPARTWRAAANYLSGHDQSTTEALLAFFDTEHFAPTNEDRPPWAPQAPELNRRIAAFTASWDGGDPHEAIAELRGYANLLATASDTIRSGVADAAFLADTKPWLDALRLWGDAFTATLDGLDARLGGDQDEASERFAESKRLASAASAIHTIPGETEHDGPVLVADGVLDTFLAAAPDRYR